MLEACRATSLGKDAVSPQEQFELVTAELAEVDAMLEALKEKVASTSQRVEDLRASIANHKVMGYFTLTT